MTPTPYRVRIVVDEDFGEVLERLPVGEPVWIVQSSTNTPVAKRLWSERPDENHLTGITTFRGTDRGREADLIDILGDIELHHGEYSADPPYSEIEVYGVGVSETIEDALCEFGFGQVRMTPDGFLALRTSVKAE